MLRLSRLWPVFLLVFVLPATAHAHASIQGMGEFINGLVHPLATPAHVLILLGVGLLLGQQTPLKLKGPLLVFVPLTAAALWLTTTGLITTVYQPVLIGIALCAGTLVALEQPIPPLVAMVLSAAAALAMGIDSAAEKGTAMSVFKTLLGTWISLVMLLGDLAFYVSFWSKKKWVKAGVRVIGSWIIAISFLVLAFALKKGGKP